MLFLKDPHYESDLVFMKSMHFPHLHQLALRLLCVPATSAPSERIFSRSGILMRPHRSRLSKDILAKLTFVKCNLDLLHWTCSALVKISLWNKTFSTDKKRLWAFTLKNSHFIYYLLKFNITYSKPSILFCGVELELEWSWSWWQKRWSWSWSGVLIPELELELSWSWILHFVDGVGVEF